MVSVLDLIGLLALKNWASTLLNPAMAVFLIFGLRWRSEQIAQGRRHEYNENESDNMDPDLLRLPSGQGRSTEP